MEFNSYNQDSSNAIRAVNLTKIYHGNIRAVDGINFSVHQGEIFGLLGPNGAGKTTVIKMILSLTPITSGSLRVFGIDVANSAEEARGMLGYVPQSISVDTDLSAYENLLIFSKLSYVGKKERDERIMSALEYMGLSGRAKDLVKHFSGGMMRRLEIAQGLVNKPKILLLDEPTIGLDPESRRHVWESIKQLKREGTTIVLTTHDMHEADELSDRIAIMSAGKIAVLGSPSELKKTVGGDIVTANLSSPHQITQFPSEIGNIVHSDEKSIQILTTNGEHAILLIADFFRSHNIKADSIRVNRPNLDDVFMKYAKARLTDEAHGDAGRSRRDLVRHAR